MGAECSWIQQNLTVCTYQVLLSFKQCDSDNGSSRYYMLFLVKNPFISSNYKAYLMTKRFNRKNVRFHFRFVRTFSRIWLHQVLPSFKQQCDSDNGSSRYYMLLLIINHFSCNYNIQDWKWGKNSDHIFIFFISQFPQKGSTFIILKTNRYSKLFSDGKFSDFFLFQKLGNTTIQFFLYPLF